MVTHASACLAGSRTTVAIFFPAVTRNENTSRNRRQRIVQDPSGDSFDRLIESLPTDKHQKQRASNSANAHPPIQHRHRPRHHQLRPVLPPARHPGRRHPSLPHPPMGIPRPPRRVHHPPILPLPSDRSRVRPTPGRGRQGLALRPLRPQTRRRDSRPRRPFRQILARPPRRRPHRRLPPVGLRGNPARPENLPHPRLRPPPQLPPRRMGHPLPRFPIRLPGNHHHRPRLV